MPLKVTQRKDRGTLQIEGWIEFPDGSRQRIRKTPESKDLKLAREEAAALEARLLRESWHGERRGSRPFAEAVGGYLAAAQRDQAEEDRLIRIITTLGNVALSAVDQDAVNMLRKKMFTRPPADATVIREVITPIRAVLRYAHRRGWCDPPKFEIPKQPEGRTDYMLPAEVKKLIMAAAPHMKAQIVFGVSTGARISEMIYLDWRDVDLDGGRATFWGTRIDAEGNKRRGTKSGKRRVAHLPPVVVAALRDLAEHCPTRIDGKATGRVFRWETPTPKRNGKAPPRVAEYADRNRKRRYGGHNKTAWKGALRRAGLNPDLTPHVMRHTWASWHYALHRDLLKLKVDGAWSSVDLVERYAHLLPDRKSVV